MCHLCDFTRTLICSGMTAGLLEMNYMYGRLGGPFPSRGGIIIHRNMPLRWDDCDASWSRKSLAVPKVLVEIPQADVKRHCFQADKCCHAGELWRYHSQRINTVEKKGRKIIRIYTFLAINIVDLSYPLTSTESTRVDMQWYWSGSGNMNPGALISANVQSEVVEAPIRKQYCVNRGDEGGVTFKFHLQSLLHVGKRRGLS